MSSEKNLNRLAMLGALSLFLSTVEYLFPRPVPFMRLGLANLPIILYLDLLGPDSKDSKWNYFLLILIKVLGQGMVNGTLASYVFFFSVVGSFSSGLTMLLSWRYLRPNISFLGVSVLGALVSNMSQILLSIVFIFGPAAWRILPLFLGIGLGSGFFIGLFVRRFSEKSRWWQAVKESALEAV